RGVPEEAGSALFPAITLAGVYDQFEDKWREPVNAPNCLFIRTCFDGQPLSVEDGSPQDHNTALDYRHGIYSRKTDDAAAGIASRRFVSMASPHLMADEYQLSFRQDGEMTLQAGISIDLWDINGPHLFDFQFEVGETLAASCVTGQKKINLAAAQCVQADFKAEKSLRQDETGVFRVYRRRVRAGETLTLRVFSAVYTSLDTSAPAGAARDCCRQAKAAGLSACLEAHFDAWEKIWALSEITLEGNEEAALFLHASQYHLNCVAPRHAHNMSIPARGLSGQTYKGAIFWDSEMFFFPMFVYTQPQIAESLLRYRIETLDGARKKAAEYGCRGAFYAWESQEGGAEGCTNFNVVDVFTHRPVRTYFRDKQIHISADIAYALRSWYDITGDRALLEEGGAKVILECARFYLSRANGHLDSERVDFADVIGPDEYHERVANNSFTNEMIRHCLESALLLKDIFADRPAWFADLLKELDYEKDWALLPALKDRICPPKERNGVFEQFDG
ncbi:MAG: glycoside hydrolase family 65 protein, partial [Deltaproteobacteria bacterium]|nr:glycoside hydrolase family 65 protein [Deltaproteobacteria bacterium]